jgi:hypothetical protein
MAIGGNVEFQVRATLPDGARLKLGPFATQREATVREQDVFGAAHASRVELLEHAGDRWRLVDVISRPEPAGGNHARWSR